MESRKRVYTQMAQEAYDKTRRCTGDGLAELVEAVYYAKYPYASDSDWCRYTVFESIAEALEAPDTEEYVVLSVRTRVQTPAGPVTWCTQRIAAVRNQGVLSYCVYGS